MIWQTTRFTIDLAEPKVMGIVNVTPDSFSDGGKHATAAAALRHCEKLIREGADILDIGGESSRPGAQPLPLEDELARVLPVVGAASVSVRVFTMVVSGCDGGDELKAYQQRDRVRQFGRRVATVCRSRGCGLNWGDTPLQRADQLARARGQFQPLP